MPTYDYACNSCGHRFEEFHSITAPTLTDCPQCGESTLQRLIGAGAGLLFKGSGFYLTDYKNAKSSAASSSRESSGNGDSSSGPASPSDDKSAAASSAAATDSAASSPASATKTGSDS